MSIRYEGVGYLLHNDYLPDQHPGIIFCSADKQAPARIRAYDRWWEVPYSGTPGTSVHVMTSYVYGKPFNAEKVTNPKAWSTDLEYTNTTPQTPEIWPRQHRDGFNTLFSDGHVKYFHDPNRTILFTYMTYYWLPYATAQLFGYFDQNP